MGCNKVIKDYEAQKEQHKADYKLVDPNSNAYTFYRGLPKQHAYYKDDDLILEEAAFDQEGWSVLVEGPGLDPVNLDEYLEENDRFVAVVSVPASAFIDRKDYFGFTLVHDPFPTGKGQQQHKNHGMLICNKTTERAKEMKKLSNWEKKPPKEKSQ